MVIVKIKIIITRKVVKKIKIGLGIRYLIVALKYLKVTPTDFTKTLFDSVYGTSLLCFFVNYL